MPYLLEVQAHVPGAWALTFLGAATIDVIDADGKPVFKRDATNNFRWKRIALPIDPRMKFPLKISVDGKFDEPPILHMNEVMVPLTSGKEVM